MEDYLEIANKKFRSRLILGTGKYSSPEECVAALDGDGGCRGGVREDVGEDTAGGAGRCLSATGRLRGWRREA